MGAPFTDITLYVPTAFHVGTPEFIEEISLVNFVSDWYVRNMNGYKPPKTSRITIQPFYHDIWHRTWKTGSIVAIASFFSYETFCSLDKQGKYKYVLDVIQTATLQLSDEYHWDKTVFENAYRKTLDSNFQFRIACASKQSRDRKKTGTFIISKTETVTSAYIEINSNGAIISRKLFDKNNSWWYDCIYYLARHIKWFDNDRFGIGAVKGNIEIWYAIGNDRVEFYDAGQKADGIDFSKYFLFN